jgi:hypothetical protein
MKFRTPALTAVIIAAGKDGTAVKPQKQEGPRIFSPKSETLFFDRLMFRGTIKPSGQTEQLRFGRIASRPSVRDFKNWRAPNE